MKTNSAHVSSIVDCNEEGKNEEKKSKNVGWTSRGRKYKVGLNVIMKRRSSSTGTYRV